MANTVVDLSSKTLGKEYDKSTVAAGDSTIYLLPKDGVVTIQLNAASSTDTASIQSSVEEYKVIKDENNLDSFAEEVSVVGTPSPKRTVDSGCTAYAVEVLTGSYTVRIRTLRNGKLIRG